MIVGKKNPRMSPVCNVLDLLYGGWPRHSPDPLGFSESESMQVFVLGLLSRRTLAVLSR